ncbi:NDP-hexose 2,3-dehydratase family protein [Amycolatopsis sp. NPDC059657]|uniref:NDP-hexose 2,3-dehydratase family protein n=1 Tax=Amycolatopsis sp. NPDC059657 TaxID=3346899 RepID=UPI00366A716D
MSSFETALRPRHDAGVAARIARSAATADGAQLDLAGFHDWFARRRAEHPFRVDRIPFAELEGWHTQEGTGNLVHRSGKFFSVQGLHVTLDSGADWFQPIIQQPEIGILGILVKEFDGVLHCLMQAKMEPGNPNLLQLSPTVQATRSNYTQVHGGSAVRYLDYFLRPERGRVLTDVLQSEHGAWFHRKHNRNMIVETTGPVPAHEDFRWLTFGQIAALLRYDNLVNMDARTVLASGPQAEVRPETWALHPDADLRSWFTAERSRQDAHAERVPLAGIPGWARTDTAIHHVDGRFFEVVAASVQAGSREVASWTQPLFRPRGPGVAAFLARPINGVLHLLAHARMEGGLRDAVEIAPTVQCIPGNYAGAGAPPRPRYLDLVLAADPARIRYEAVHSEEGGRFLDAEARYLVIEVDDSEVPLDTPPGYNWVTPGQLNLLVQQGHCVNVQARTLVACLAAMERLTGV